MPMSCRFYKQKYPEDAMNRAVCTICADYLTCENCVTCPCGHTFHNECIVRWKEQSSTCPQCRERFKAPIKLYFELSREDKAEGDPAELRNEVTELKLKLRVRDSSIDTLKKQNDSLSQGKQSKEQELKTVQQLLENTFGTNDALKKQLTYMEKFKNDAKRAKDEVISLQKKVVSYRNIQELVDSESADIETTMKNFADNPDAFNQISTSYVVLKKEFDRLKESKRILENDKKTLRKKAESYARESFESKEQLKVVTNDLKHIDERNKSLSQKLKRLEESFASASPRSSAIKRFLCESPAPADLKRQCITDIKEDHNEQMADESLPLFGDGHTEDSGICESNTEDLDLDEEESIKIADEFGLNYVATTSTASERKPLKDLTKKINKSSFVSRKQNPGLSHNSKVSVCNENSDLPHFRRGFNGMGGQSKTLIIPKKIGSFVKQPVNKKSSIGFKIPKNNTKITKFISQPKLPTIELSP